MMVVPFVLNSVFNFLVGILVARFLGPTEYGAFALALSVAIVMQTILFDWLRLAATRFYSEKDRSDRPQIRATLDLVLALVTGLSAVAAAAIVLSGDDFSLSNGIAALAVGACAANGLFDFSTALVRARFHNRAYAALVITKNALAMTLTVGGAWWFGSAKAALLGLILSIAGALAFNVRALMDRHAGSRHAEGALVKRYAVYALPIVAANVLYQVVPATNRAMVTHLHSLAEAGQLALAYEIGIRIVGTIGSTLDALLFQLAVLAEKTFGPAAARDRVRTNMGIVLAVVAPTVGGVWLVLPSFERLIVPEGYCGPFAHYFALMLPALLCFALANYCIGPAFQIAHRTLPLIAGGVAAVVADGLAIALLPSSRDASTFALAQSISSAAALLVMVAFMLTLEPMWPRVRDLVGTLVAVVAMIILGLPLRTMQPGFATLLAQVGFGFLVYATVVLAADVAQLRSMLRLFTAAWLAKRRTPAHEPAGQGHATGAASR